MPESPGTGNYVSEATSLHKHEGRQVLGADDQTIQQSNLQAGLSYTEPQSKKSRAEQKDHNINISQQDNAANNSQINNFLGKTADKMDFSDRKKQKQQTFNSDPINLSKENHIPKSFNKKKHSETNEINSNPEQNRHLLQDSNQNKLPKDTVIAPGDTNITGKKQDSLINDNFSNLVDDHFKLINKPDNNTLETEYNRLSKSLEHKNTRFEIGN
jgi:hypothetical protein